MLLASEASVVADALADDLAKIEAGTNHDEVKWMDVAVHACQILNASKKVMFVTASELVLHKGVIDDAQFLVDDTSRLARSTEGVLSIYRRLSFAGMQLIAVSQNIDSLHDQAETLLSIHGLIDSTYVRELAKKTHRGCESAVLRGFHVGRKGYGYRAVPEGTTGPKRLVIEEAQAEVVRQMFEMSAAGYSLKGIARKLNEELIGGRGDWCPTGVRSMLKQQLYKGEVIWNRTKFEKVPGTNKRRAKRRDATRASGSASSAPTWLSCPSSCGIGYRSA